jgi:hypothetical protein
LPPEVVIDEHMDAVAAYAMREVSTNIYLPVNGIGINDVD